MIRKVIAPTLFQSLCTTRWILLKSVLKIKFRKVRSNRTFPLRITRDHFIIDPFRANRPSLLELTLYASISVLFRLPVQLSLFSLSLSLALFLSSFFSLILFPTLHYPHRINRFLTLTHSISFIPFFCNVLSLSLSFPFSLSRIRRFRMHLYSFMQAKTQSPSLAFFLN